MLSRMKENVPMLEKELFALEAKHEICVIA